MINEPDFWRDCFKKAPLVTSFAFVGTLIGVAVGAVLSAWILQSVAPRTRVPVVFGAVIIVAFGFPGLIIGLIVGVIVDSIVGLFRGEPKKKKAKKRAAKETSISDLPIPPDHRSRREHW